MGDLVKIGAHAPMLADASAHDLTIAVCENHPGVPVQVAQLVYTQLVMPVTTMFDGGRVLPESERIMLYRMYVEDLAGFEPEAYAIARKLLVRDRKDRFRPTSAEVREYLEKAELQHYKAGGQVRKLERLEAELWSSIVGKPWDAGRLGPPPGKPGCRVSDEMLVAELGKCLGMPPGSCDLADARRPHDKHERNDLGDLKVGPHLGLRRMRIASRGLGIDLLQYAACRPLIDEARIPRTPEEIAKADAEFAEWERERYLKILADDVTKAWQNRNYCAVSIKEKWQWRDGERALKQRLLDDAQRKLDDAERAVAVEKGLDLVAWEAERAAKCEAEKAAAEADHTFH